MKNSDKSQWHPKRWLSGERAKNFRRRLGATAASGKGGHTFTFKFPLAAVAPDEVARDTLRLQYRRLASFKQHSLFHFFAAVHLAGFRLFTNESSARAHVNKVSRLNSEINKQFRKAFQLQGSAGTDLLKELGKDFRSNKKNFDGVRHRIRDALSVSKTNDDELGGPLSEFIDALSRRITDGQLWAKNKERERWGAVVDAGKDAGLSFALPEEGEYKFRVLWDGATQSFLGNAKYAAEDDLEYAMQQMVSLAAFIARTENRPEKETTIKEVLLSDTQNYNALAWLLNPKGGIRFFSQPISDIRESGFRLGDCPGGALNEIRRAARALLEERQTGYDGFRSLFGGGVASFISNYWKRLNELNSSLEKIGEQPCDLEGNMARLKRENGCADIGEEFAQKLPGGFREFNRILESLTRKKAEAQEALDALMGKGAHVAGKEHVEKVEEFSDSFEECRGLALQLAEIIRKRTGGKKGDNTVAGKYLPEYFFPKSKETEDGAEDAAKLLRRKLNRYRGAPVYSAADIEQVLREDSERLQLLRRRRAAHWKNIEAQSAVDIVAGHETTEQQRAGTRAQRISKRIDFSELACRRILQRIADAVRKCGDEGIRNGGMALFDDAGVFAGPKNFAEFFVERRGRLYKSPFSEYRHDALPLGGYFAGNRMREETKKFVLRFCRWVEGLDVNGAKIARDAALLEQCVFGLRVSGLSSGVPSALAKWEPDCEMSLPVSVHLALENDQVQPGVVARIFNGYGSEISGLCAKLSREKIIAKIRLQHIGDKALYWLPKAGKGWRLPDTIARGDSALAKGWRYLQVEDKTLFVDGDTDKGIAAEHLAGAVKLLAKNRANAGGENMLRACLREIPHDWYYKASRNYAMLKPATEEKHKPFVNDDSLLEGLLEIKSGKIGLKNRQVDRDPKSYIRLAGPSRYKGWLDKALLDDGRQKVTFGDTSLVAEEEYAQLFDNGAMRAEYVKTRLQAAVVFNVTYNGGRADAFPWNKFIAIDLGERGIGWAVFSAPDAKAKDSIAPDESGHVAVPALRHLIRRVDHHRRKKQPAQRFQSNSNLSLQHMREAAIGELAGVIDALMDKHKAFPVFESSVGGFESGGRMLKTIYGSILRLYTFSAVDAHQTKRAAHWLTGKAPRWEHPLWKKKADGKPLYLYPGAVVYPAYTSQTCSEYGENPLQLIKQLKENGVDIPLVSDRNGMLALGADAGAPRIYIYGGKEDRRDSDNRLPALGKVKKNFRFNGYDELKTHVKNELRHKPPSMRSKDTAQSSYLSPFVDVQERLGKLADEQLKERQMFRRNGLVFMHADVNAAINIGRKWWREKIAGGDG